MAFQITLLSIKILKRPSDETAHDSTKYLAKRRVSYYAGCRYTKCRYAECRSAVET